MSETTYAENPSKVCWGCRATEHDGTTIERCCLLESYECYLCTACTHWWDTFAIFDDRSKALVLANVKRSHSAQGGTSTTFQFDPTWFWACREKFIDWISLKFPLPKGEDAGD